MLRYFMSAHAHHNHVKPKQKVDSVMQKDLIEDNLESVKEILENTQGDDALIMIASINEDGNPVLHTIEGKVNMSKDIACMLLSAALTATRDGSGSDGEVTEGYILEPVVSTPKEIQ